MKARGTLKLSGFVMLSAVFLALGCGPDRAMLMDTKFEVFLRQKMSSIGPNGLAEMLSVKGKCSDSIDAYMRQGLIGAGAEVLTMNGETFTATISSEDIFNVAALEFVEQLQLSGEPKRK